MQQGFTAEVNCAATSDSDPHIRINQTNVADGIFEVALCCTVDFFIMHNVKMHNSRSA